MKKERGLDRWMDRQIHRYTDRSIERKRETELKIGNRHRKGRIKTNYAQGLEEKAGVENQPQIPQQLRNRLPG